MFEWNILWLRLFGDTQWLGLDWGFWIAMGLTGLIVVFMNVFFWALPPKKDGITKID